MVDLLETAGWKNRSLPVARGTLTLGEGFEALEDHLRDCWCWAEDKSKLLQGTFEVEEMPTVSVYNAYKCSLHESSDIIILHNNEAEDKETEAM